MLCSPGLSLPLRTLPEGRSPAGLARVCVPVTRSGPCPSHLPDPGLLEDGSPRSPPPGPSPERVPRGCVLPVELKGSAQDPGGTRWRLWAPCCPRPEPPCPGPRWSPGWPGLHAQPQAAALDRLSVPPEARRLSCVPAWYSWAQRRPRAGRRHVCQTPHRRSTASPPGVDLTFRQMSADTNTVSNPFVPLSQCLRGSWVEPSFWACLGARRPPGETPGQQADGHTPEAGSGPLVPSPHLTTCLSALQSWEAVPIHWPSPAPRPDAGSPRAQKRPHPLAVPPTACRTLPHPGC